MNLPKLEAFFLNTECPFVAIQEVVRRGVAGLAHHTWFDNGGRPCIMLCAAAAVGKTSPKVYYDATPEENDGTGGGMFTEGLVAKTLGIEREVLFSMTGEWDRAGDDDREEFLRVLARHLYFLEPPQLHDETQAESPTELVNVASTFQQTMIGCQA